MSKRVITLETKVREGEWVDEGEDEAIPTQTLTHSLARSLTHSLFRPTPCSLLSVHTSPKVSNNLSTQTPRTPPTVTPPPASPPTTHTSTPTPPNTQCYGGLG